jgi:hypothetical protein
MKMMIDTIQDAIEIPYIGENHAAFANHVLGRLQVLIKDSIRNNQPGIPFEKVCKAIVEARDYTSNFSK